MLNIYSKMFENLDGAISRSARKKGRYKAIRPKKGVWPACLITVTVLVMLTCFAGATDSNKYFMLPEMA